MSALRLTVDLRRIADNARAVVGACRSLGIEVVGVTKGVCGRPEIARAMLDGGVIALGDARLDNILRMRKDGIRAPLMLIRSPAPSEVADCVALADLSLNADLRVLSALSAEAVRQGKTHQVILMADLDTGREGFAPEEMPEACRRVLGMEGLALQGLGLYLDFRSDDDGVIRTQEHFVALARQVEAQCGRHLPVVSGGSTNVFRRTMTIRPVPGINQLRIGTTILLGWYSSTGPIRADGCSQDTFVLEAELIEVKKRSGLLGLLALGSLDAPKEFLFPVAPDVRIVNATNDHTVVELGESVPPPRPGDRLAFRLGYSALNRLMASPYVRIRFGDTKELLT